MENNDTGGDGDKVGKESPFANNQQMTPVTNHQDGDENQSSATDDLCPTISSIEDNKIHDDKNSGLNSGDPQSIPDQINSDLQFEQKKSELNSDQNAGNGV